MSTPAKDAMIQHHVTMADVQWNDGYKPRCLWCFIPCDPRSREYRATHLCEYCYDEQPPIQTQRKELLHAKRSDQRIDVRPQPRTTGDGTSEEGSGESVFP
jgi:hypothetical protein